VDVNRLEVGLGGISTTMRRGGSAVLGFLLSGVGVPVLLHHRAGDDVEHRVLDVLLDQSTEGGVLDLGWVDGGFVLVSLSPRYDLRAKPRKTRGYQKTKETGPDIRNFKFQTSGRGRQKQAGVTDREELAKV